jgi:putative intracellular protease/amidase
VVVMGGNTMSKNTIFMYVLNTMADWEWGYITAELKTGRFFKKGIPAFTIKTVSLSKEPIATMGGVRIIPDLSIDEINTQDCALLLLPGGETWMDSRHASILERAKDCLDSGIPVAAICGATMALASVGILDTYRHTSNDFAYLKKECPNYHGEENFQLQSAVTDGDLITASGIAPLELAYQVFKRLDVFSDETLDCWYQLHKIQDPQYFYKLMQSLG